ncbi:MAG: hypothetical protein NZ805_13435 [Armatimonadetes bacterium]|nr:hypothetical protein [Armatimonadota bacterium]MDW8027084.1 hypothetical protein [Armatimonadota bacterium]
MRFVHLMLVAAFLVSVAVSQEVQLSVNFVVGGSATRIVSGKVSGEWHGPTPLSPTKPVTFTFDLSVRAQSLITVVNVTPEGDGVVVIQNQGAEVKGTAGDQLFELVVTPEGDVKFLWGALSFDSTKLPEADRKKLQKLVTLSPSLTISPKGKIKEFQLPEEVKKVVPELDVQFVNAIVTATLQTLLPAPLPEKPVKVGQSWELQIPVLAFETAEPLTLPITCTLAEVRGDEAVIRVSAEAKGDANLTLRRWSEKDPKVTILNGSLLARGEVLFLLSFGVPQRSEWKISAEAEGSVTLPEKDASPVPFRFRLSAEIREHLVF